MKKILATLAGILALGTAAFAQVEVINPAPGIEVQFKRCIAKNDTVHVDFLITNHTGKEVIAHPMESIKFYEENFQSIAYDDEGNTYFAYGDRKMKINRLTLSGITYPLDNFYLDVTLPVDIGVRGRLEIIGLDKFATKFQSLSIAFRGTMNDRYNGQTKVVFKNVPITRDE